jgi:hypothetical protein
MLSVAAVDEPSAAPLPPSLPPHEAMIAANPPGS